MSSQMTMHSETHKKLEIFAQIVLHIEPEISSALRRGAASANDPNHLIQSGLPCSLGRLPVPSQLSTPFVTAFVPR